MKVLGIQVLRSRMIIWYGSWAVVGKMLAKEDNPNARLEGFEPTTLGSEDRCSIR